MVTLLLDFTSIDDRVKDYEKSDGSFAKKQGGIFNAIFLINWANHFLVSMNTEEC